MRVSEVMTRGVELVPGDVSVQEAATAMAEHDIGAVLVGTEERLDGVLTDRDIIIRVVVEGRDPARVLVRDVMSSALFACRDDAPAEATLREMDVRQVRRFPVLDDDGRLVGIVTRRDLTRASAGCRASARPPPLARADDLGDGIAPVELP
jgi:CBS domain-containing protein